jgi:hypothetical protein
LRIAVTIARTCNMRSVALWTCCSVGLYMHHQLWSGVAIVCALVTPLSRGEPHRRRVDLHDRLKRFGLAIDLLLEVARRCLDRSAPAGCTPVPLYWARRSAVSALIARWPVISHQTGAVRRPLLSRRGNG